jgi:hypothetical protein
MVANGKIKNSNGRHCSGINVKKSIYVPCFEIINIYSLKKWQTCISLMGMQMATVERPRVHI